MAWFLIEYKLGKMQRDGSGAPLHSKSTFSGKIFAQNRQPKIV
jgi:hypothetical protein